MIQTQEEIREELDACLAVLKDIEVKFPSTSINIQINRIRRKLSSLSEDEEEYKKYEKNVELYVFSNLTLESFIITESVGEDNMNALEYSLLVFPMNEEQKIKDYIHLYIETQCNSDAILDITILESLKMQRYMLNLIEFSKPYFNHNVNKYQGNLRRRQLKMMYEGHRKDILNSMNISIKEGNIEIVKIIVKFEDLQVSSDIPKGMLVDSYFINHRSFAETSEFVIDIDGEFDNSLASILMSYLCGEDIEIKTELDKTDISRLSFVADNYQLKTLINILELFPLIDTKIRFPLRNIEREDIHIKDDIYVIRVIDKKTNKVASVVTYKKKGLYHYSENIPHLVAGDIFSDMIKGSYLKIQNHVENARVENNSVYKRILSFQPEVIDTFRDYFVDESLPAEMPLTRRGLISN